MNKITVAPCRQNNHYQVMILRTGSNYPSKYDRLSKGDAAAKAAELSASCYGKYQILGDESILDMIRNGGIIGDNR